MEVQNRIVMPPMTANFAGVTGAVTRRLIDYYLERARGGVGLIIVEATCIDSPIGKLDDALQLCIDHDKFMAGLNDLSEAVHEYDVKASLQLHHAGRQTNLVTTEGRQPVSASEVYCTATNVKPRALTIREIEEIVEKYAQAARRAKIAGFDAVEMHAAHGYLIEQFLSTATNKRTDRYGGDLNGRMKFALEILERTRELVGRDFPIMFRLSGDEYLESGLTLNDTKVIAIGLEKAGVDCLDISAGTYDSPQRGHSTQPMAIPRGFMVHLAKGIKEVVDVPVITVGRINDPTLAEEIIRDGKADLVAMGRALFADPCLPRKAAEGRLDDINMCIACMRCTERTGVGLHPKCAVNAALGMEKEYQIHLAKKPKKVLIIGGGPAGMEAARVAALRGHKVILCEKDRLGGQLNLSIVPPHKEEVRNFMKYLVNQLEKLEIEIRLNEEATKETVVQIKPDVVIAATGAEPLVPRIPGTDQENVMTAWDVLRGEAMVGEKVAIVGGGMVGCETAEYLAEMGRSVKIIEMLDDIGVDMEANTKLLLKERLAKLQIEVFTETKVTEITENDIIVANCKDGKDLLRADTIVLALGSVANRKVIKELMGKIHKLHLIGDCVKPRKILEAIHDGARIARQI